MCIVFPQRLHMYIWQQLYTNSWVSDKHIRIIVNHCTYFLSNMLLLRYHTLYPLLVIGCSQIETAEIFLFTTLEKKRPFSM